MTKPSMKATLCGLATAALAAGHGGLAASQPATAPAQPPAAAPSLSGPLVPGVCLLSQQVLIADSKVGQAANARLRSLAQQAQTSLDAEKANIEKKERALNAQRGTLAPAQLQAQAQALNRNIQALQAEAAERSRQIDATRAKALGGILQQAQPYIAQAYATHACGLLVSREAVLGGNLTNDLTPEVLAALDAKAVPVPFDLEPPTSTPTK